MAHQDQQVAGTKSKDVDVNDDTRLYECAKKYDTIVKQFDELVGVMNTDTSVPKRRKSRKGSASSAKAAVSSGQPNNNEAVVAQTVTRFLHELKVNPTDSEGSRST